MTAFTEFSFSRRIQSTAAYKVHRSVDQKIATGRCGSDLAVRAMALGSVKTGAGKRWSKAEAARFTAAYREFLPPPFNGRACGFSLSPTPGL